MTESTVASGVTLGVIGHIKVFHGSIPGGWLPCDGSLHPIDIYPSLFAVIGAVHGGNGKDHFAVPKLGPARFGICADGWFPREGTAPADL